MGDVRALVVEDSRVMRGLLVEALRRAGGLEVEEAEDGLDALRKLKASRFDLVLVDLNMPIMDGLKLLEVLRKDEDYKKTPVVIVTTEAAAADRQRAFALGANAYVTKPIKSQEVIETVRAVLQTMGPR